MADQTEATATPRQRGPGYPGIDLETAIERIRQLAKVSDKHPVPVADAAAEWGYSPRSSNTLKTAAALKRFGLVDDVGDGTTRKLRVTATGREVLFYADDRDSPKRRELLRQAALRPKIHSEVLDEYDGALPDDRVVLAHLQFQMGMHADAARDFLRRLRKTVQFAGLDERQPTEGAPLRGAVEEPAGAVSTRLSGGSSPHTRAYGGPVSQDLVTGEIRLHSVNIPYSPGKWASLNADFPLSEREWNAMMAMLAAMKPGLVADDQDPGDAVD
jgi:hypothetical protein